MATIIDSLVIELGLDTKRFTELQKKAIDDLKRLEDAGVRHGQRVERHVSTGLQSLVRFIENPIASARRHLETLAQPAQRSAQQLQNLGAQGRRSGTDVESGALAGAAGLRVLGGAGLLAWSALTAVNKVMSSVHENAQKTFNASIGASGAGIGIQRYTAIAQALSISGNVPKEQTQGWLTQFGQLQAHWQKFGGTPPEVSSALFSTGSNINTPIQQILRNFANASQRLSDRDAISRGSDIGLTPEIARELKRLGPGGFDRRVSEAERLGRTSFDEEKSKEFLSQFNRLNAELDRFTTNWVNSISPQFGKMAEAFTAFIKWLNVEGFDKNKDRVPLTPEQREQRWRDKPFQRWWRRQTQGPEGTAAIPPRGTSNDDLQSGPFGPTGGIGGSHQRDGYSYNGPTSPTESSGNWEVRNNNFAGIRRPGIVAGPNSGGFQTYATPEEGIQAISKLLLAYNDKHGLNTLQGIISRWAPPNENDTQGLIGRASRVSGFAPGQQLNLRDPATMSKVVEAMIRGEQGGKLPDSAKSALQNFSKYAKPIGTSSGQVPPPPGIRTAPEPTDGVGDNGKPYQRKFGDAGDPTGAMRYGDVQPPHRTLQASFGDITIHTAATNARDIADEFRERVRQNLAVANLNTGFV